jgi:YVTN family beta-propeller protein
MTRTTTRLFSRSTSAGANTGAGRGAIGASGLLALGVLVYGTLAAESLPESSFSPRVNPSFINWESPHVHPLEMTPDGGKLLAVNTPDNRLSVFSIASGTPRLVGEVPVGLDPVSVRVRTSSEAWVVNHISDTISVVDLSTLNVVRTIPTHDEPRDVVFAGARAFVSCSTLNRVQVFVAANPDPATSNTLSLTAESPRAMGVSPDGTKVYVAAFESGNRSTILGGGATNAGVGGRLGFPPNVVSDPAGPYAGVNPPPNSGTTFEPPRNTGAGTPPAVGLIVKKNAQGQWMDDNTHDWTALVSGASSTLSGRVPGWDLLDHDLAVIDASSLSVSYRTGLMNIAMALGVNPASGEITIVGTDATNEVRFEPNVKGTFVRVKMASVTPSSAAQGVVDLNPHLTYAVRSLPQSERDRSIGDPRAIVWNAAGTLGFVAGMGSNNVIVINPGGARAGLSDTIPVGEGPTGLALDEARGRLYVLNKFASTISVVNLSSQTATASVAVFDPSPPAIKLGRKHLYDTRKTSGLGQASCASCHVDARMDRLAWDLGDPAGATQALVDLNLGGNVPGLNTGFLPFHPMKGPMTTQTLQDIIQHEPHHWRGDRSGIEAFNPAFVGLNGDDVQLTAGEMQEFENFLATIYFPPNPFRNLDNTLPNNLPLPGHYTIGRFAPAGQPLPNGNAVAGLALYRSTTRPLDGGQISCVSCHTLPTGMGTDYRLQGITYQPIAPGAQGQRHHAVVSVDGSTNVTIKIPQTRNIYKKGGFNATQQFNTAGFGFLHDGSVDSIERFVGEPVFSVASDQEIADLTAFMLSFSGSDLPMGSPSLILEPPGPLSQDSHAAVGKQVTVVSQATLPPAELALLNSFVTLANSGKVGLVVKGKQGGLQRGYRYNSASVFQSDRAGETRTLAQLLAAAAPGSELTFTVVMKDSETRIGIDRDLDGFFDRDELDACGDPTNPANHSGTCPCPADLDDGSGTGTPDQGVTIDDLVYFLDKFSLGDTAADLDDGSGLGIPDQGVTIDDLIYYLDHFVAGC